MARTSVVNIFGDWINGPPCLELLKLIQQQNGLINYCDNTIIGVVYNSKGDYVQTVEKFVGKSDDPFLVAKDLFYSVKNFSLYCLFKINSFNICNLLNPTPNGLRVTLLSGHPLLEGGIMDFNWQYNHWVSVLDQFIKINGVEFSDFL